MLSSSFEEYTNWKLKVRIDSMELAGLNNISIHNNNNNSSSRGGGNDAAGELDRFLYDIDAIKEDMKTMEKLKQRLQEYSDDSRNIRVTTTMKELSSIMDSEMDHVLILAKAIMKRLESLGKYTSNSSVSSMGFGGEKKLSAAAAGVPSSSIEKTRMSVVAGLGKKLRDIMDEYQGLRAKMAATYKETIEYRYLSLTGEKKYIEDIEKLVSSGEIEEVIKEAVDDADDAAVQGRVSDVLEDIRHRREGAKHMQKQLIDLHQLLLDMVSVVEAQSQRITQDQLQQQQMQMSRGGNSFIIRPGAAQLQDSNWDHDKDAKKRGTIALILIVVLIVVLIFPLFQFESDNGRE